MDGLFENWLRSRANDEEVDDGRLSQGTVIGQYCVDVLLGKGGFAEVYRAKDKEGHVVAIKLLHRLDEKSRLRFERESRILAQVHHRNLPRFFGFGTCGNRPYIVTELLRPCELPKKDRAVARFLGALMSAVGEIHRHGFVHRDITPANILCRADGEPVLIDFGLAVPMSEALREQAALSYEGERKIAVGTPGFSAPEQFSGQVSGAASDVHALGALIGACMGEKLPRCWKRIYLTATNSNPRVRYQTMTTMHRAVALRHLRKWLVAILGMFALVTLGIVLHGGYFAKTTSEATGNDDHDWCQSEPIQLALPVTTGAAGTNEVVASNLFLECRIEYKKLRQKQSNDGNQLLGFDVVCQQLEGKLTTWLKLFIAEYCEDNDVETLCEDYLDNNLQERADDELKQCLRELGAEEEDGGWASVKKYIDVESIFVSFEPNAAFEDELKRWREEKQSEEEQL